MRGSEAKHIVAWVLRAVLAAAFLLSASGKLMGGEGVVAMFRNWGLPDGFHLVIGVLELLGGIGLLIPRLAVWSALGLIGIMLGATGTHLVHGELARAAVPVAFLAALSVVAWLRRPGPD